MEELFVFEVALEKLKEGRGIQRDGWNGKGLVVKMQTPDEHSQNTRPYAYILAGAERVPWLPSQTDLFADDWRILA